MKRINLLIGCLTALVSITAYSMDDNEDERPFSTGEQPRISRPPLRTISLQEANSPASSRGVTPVAVLLSIENDNTGTTPQTATPITPLTTPTPGTLPTQLPLDIRMRVDQIFAAQEANQLTDEEALMQLRILLRSGIPTPRGQSENQLPQD